MTTYDPEPERRPASTPLPSLEPREGAWTPPDRPGVAAGVGNGLPGAPVTTAEGVCVQCKREFYTLVRPPLCVACQQAAPMKNPWAPVVLQPESAREVEFAKGCAAALLAYRKRNEAHAALQVILDDLQRLAAEQGSSRPS